MITFIYPFYQHYSSGKMSESEAVGFEVQVLGTERTFRVEERMTVGQLLGRLNLPSEMEPLVLIGGVEASAEQEIPAGSKVTIVPRLRGG